MDRNKAKETAKLRLEEYLNIITTKQGRKYVCPFCGSGTGPNKTPAGNLTPDKQRFHCFSCSFNGDIFDIVGKIEGIANNAEIFKRVYEMFGLQTGELPRSNRFNAAKNPVSSLKDYTQYYKQCHGRAGETDYFSFRGLSDMTVKLFNLGYDPQWRSLKALSTGKNPPASSRVIIPTSSRSYVARATDPDADPKFKAIKEGPAEIFNPKALQGTNPVFIVEGEFDALSVIEAGGQSLSLGSTSNKRKLIELLTAQTPSAPLILSLDNDEAGRKAQAEMADALKGLKIAFLEADINGGYKGPQRTPYKRL